MGFLVDPSRVGRPRFCPSGILKKNTSRQCQNREHNTQQDSQTEALTVQLRKACSVTIQFQLLFILTAKLLSVVKQPNFLSLRKRKKNDWICFDGWKLLTEVQSTVFTHPNANRPNKFFWSDGKEGSFFMRSNWATTTTPL